MTLDRVVVKFSMDFFFVSLVSQGILNVSKEVPDFGDYTAVVHVDHVQTACHMSAG